MLQTDPTPARPFRRFRRTAFGLVAVVVVASGIAAGGGAAFADDATTYGDLQTAFTGSATLVDMRNDIDASTSTLTLASGATTVLNLHGHTLRLDTLQLTTVDQSTLIPSGSTLSIIGGGSLIVNHASDTTTAAIEVDSSSSLTLDDVTVVAGFASGNAGVKAAAIGGGLVGGTTQTAGTITIQDDADVTATGSTTGAAIGGGNRGGGGTINVSDASLTATSTGNGAAIGGGANPLGGATGTVNVTNHSIVTANASGAGSAIGGGVAGGGGAVNVGDFAQVMANASAGQVAIGDGAGSNQGLTFSTTEQSSVTATGGSGAGIGSGAGATGNDVINIGGRSTVVASAINGPGVGSTGNTIAPQVNVTDTAALIASGGGSGAGIGAGNSSSIGAQVAIGTGATVTVNAASGVSAVGGATGAKFGSFSNSGSLTLPAGQSIIIPSGAQLSTSGAFTNNGTITVAGQLVVSGSMTNNGTITGSGFVSNAGAIVQNGTFGAPVDGSYYHILFDSQGGSVSPIEEDVWADSLSSVGLSLPTATPPSIGSFSGWNASPDGTGGMLTNGASISGLTSPSTVNQPGTLRVYALYQLQPVLRVDNALPQGVVGTSYSASVAATTGTAPISYTYTGDLPAGLSLDYSTGLITGTPTTSGTFTMHLTGHNAAGSATHDYTIQIVATVLHVTAPEVPKAAARYLAGGRFDVTLAGLQANESYTVYVGGKSVATGRAPTNQAFSVRTSIPRTIGDGTQTVKLTGADHALGATTSIMTASVSKSLGLKLSAKSVKHGKKVVVSVSKLYPGESTRVVITGPHGKVNVGKAGSKGTYTLTLKSGLAKGKYTVTVTGAGTGRKASTKLTVS